MYTQSAQWYDALYSFKDYKAETDQLLALLSEKRPNAKTLLDVACGTAEHDRYLSEHYQVDGIDLEPEFIHIAAAKNRAGRYTQADMSSFDLDRTYDIILCLFSSIGYLCTLDRVGQALQCLKRHLAPGGLLLVEPWFTPATWHPDHPAPMLTAEGEGFSICRMTETGQAGALSFFTCHYLLAQGKEVQYFSERHELGLFNVAEMTAAFQQAGFAVTYDEEGLIGRGLYLAELSS
jgi:SAM-dependent methyltransferase